MGACLGLRKSTHVQLTRETRNSTDQSGTHQTHQGTPVGAFYAASPPPEPHEEDPVPKARTVWVSKGFKQRDIWSHSRDAMDEKTQALPKPSFSSPSGVLGDGKRKLPKKEPQPTPTIPSKKPTTATKGSGDADVESSQKKRKVRSKTSKDKEKEQPISHGSAQRPAKQHVVKAVDKTTKRPGATTKVHVRSTSSKKTKTLKKATPPKPKTS